jgi:hypothetical protein
VTRQAEAGHRSEQTGVECLRLAAVTVQDHPEAVFDKTGSG